MLLHHHEIYQRKHHTAQTRHNLDFCMGFFPLGITYAVNNYLICLGERQSKIVWQHPLQYL